MSEQVLLADIDNTLYDWPAFFAPSFRAMVHVLARELGVAEDQLYDEFKDVFGRHQSLEYAFAIQELATVQGLEPERVRRLIEQGRGAFKSVQRKRLQPYPGVVETLKWLELQRVRVVGITNSPAWRAQQRLYELRLDELMYGLVAWEGFEGSLDDPHTKGFVKGGRTRGQTRLSNVWTVPEQDCKPSQQHYVFALEAVGAKAESSWAVGDSLAKDLEPAAQVGIKTIWARYGASFEPNESNMKTLLRITHWTPSRIDTTYHKDDFSPDFAVNCFDELQGILPATVLSLF